MNCRRKQGRGVGVFYNVRRRKVGRSKSNDLRGVVGNAFHPRSKGVIISNYPTAKP
jgi:hypothetical protein